MCHICLTGVCLPWEYVNILNHITYCREYRRDIGGSYEYGSGVLNSSTRKLLTYAHLPGALPFLRRSLSLALPLAHSLFDSICSLCLSLALFFSQHSSPCCFIWPGRSIDPQPPVHHEDDTEIRFAVVCWIRCGMMVMDVLRPEHIHNLSIHRER